MAPLVLTLVATGSGSLSGLPIDPVGCQLMLGASSVVQVGFGVGDPMSYETNFGVLMVEPVGVRMVGKWVAPNSHKDLRLLQLVGSVAYFSYDSESLWSQDKIRDANVLRLDLQSGRWLNPIHLPAKSGLARRVIGLAARGDAVSVLTASVETEGLMEIKSPFLLNTLSTKNLQPIWKTEINSDGKLNLSQWGWRHDRYTGRIEISALQWADASLAVCLGPEGPILSYDNHGKLSWRLDRPWEIVRKFIGPSVFSHYLQRRAENTSWFEASPAHNPHVDSEMTGSIVAGPIWVKTRTGNNVRHPYQSQGNFVVAVAQAGHQDSSPDCVLYEISEEGRLASRTVVPQFVLGGGERSVPDGIVFACSNESAARFSCFNTQDSMSSMGPFRKPDETGTLTWFVQTKQRWTDELLELYPYSAVAETDAIAYSRTKMIRCSEGWHCEKKDGGQLVFPIQAIDLKDGSRVEGALRVPITIPISKPSTNYAGVEKRFSALFPLYAGITRMEVIKGTLRVFLRDQDKGGYVDFPLPPRWR